MTSLETRTYLRFKGRSSRAGHLSSSVQPHQRVQVHGLASSSACCTCCTVAVIQASGMPDIAEGALPQLPRQLPVLRQVPGLPAAPPQPLLCQPPWPLHSLSGGAWQPCHNRQQWHPGQPGDEVAARRLQGE